MKNIKKVIVIIVLIMLMNGTINAAAQTSNDIIFKDNNLYNALCKFYNWKDSFTKEDASRLSENEMIIARNSNISNIEGLQYFDNITTLYIGGNNLEDLKPISKIPSLLMLNISNNSIKGKQFIIILNNADKMNNLDDVNLDNNELPNIDFLSNIGNLGKYERISMKENKISNISILRNCNNLFALDLSDNRITDVTPLKNLKKLTGDIDLRDNCIINYKPIKHLFDKLYEDFDWENGMDRYDYYTNPVNFSYNGKKIKFPYLTVYYKYQGYAEANPLFKAIGGSAKYNKKSGTLTCKYDGKVLVFKDFSNKYTLNGEDETLEYPMRRMQYDLAYVPVKDICEVLGLNYNVVKTREFYVGGGNYTYAPKIVTIGDGSKE